MKSTTLLTTATITLLIFLSNVKGQLFQPQQGTLLLLHPPPQESGLSPELKPPKPDNHHKEQPEEEEEPSKKNKEEKSPSPSPPSDLSPLESYISTLLKPETLLPLVNELVFATLVGVHMPAIVPAILIPLSFFAVGALLIPIVRVNYFVNNYLNNDAPVPAI